MKVDYTSVQAFFSPWSSLYDAPAWQGWLMGFLAAGIEDKTPWYEHAREWLDIEGAYTPSQEDLLFLDGFAEHTLTQLTQASTPILLLPDDSASPFSVRIQSLTMWAEFFLLGFAALSQSQTLSATTQEALQDIADISRAVEGDDDDSELEQYYQQIVEHAGLLAGVIFAELHGESNTVH